GERGGLHADRFCPAGRRCIKWRHCGSPLPHRQPPRARPRRAGAPVHGFLVSGSRRRRRVRPGRRGRGDLHVQPLRALPRRGRPLSGDAVRHATQHVAELVAHSSGVTGETAARSFTVRTGQEVTEHLFAVASGLDAMVVGEREIAGQVKRALAEAREQETTSKTLELLFQTASRTSKRVGTQTELGAAGRSVVALALDLAEREVPPWDSTRAVLIGTGSYAGASVAALRARGCTDIRVFSRSGRAATFAASHDVQPVDSLVEALADADLVVSCSGARGRAAATGTGDGTDLAVVEGDVGSPATLPHLRTDAAPEASLGHVLDAAGLVRARERAADRAGDEPEPRPLVILDLALHRDVHPGVADVEGVLLYDLATLKAHAPAVAHDVVAQAQAIVDD